MKQHPSIPFVTVGNLNVSAMNFSSTLEWIDARLDQAECSHVSTANLELLKLCVKSPAFGALLNEECDLVTADGMSLEWLSSSIALPERIAAAELVPLICALAAAKKLRVYLLGGNEDVTRNAADSLVRHNPGLDIAGVDCSRFNAADPEHVDDVILRIRNAKTDILFAALGCPKQERFITQNKQRFGARLAMGVGTAFDFIAGRRRWGTQTFQRPVLQGSATFYAQGERTAVLI